MIDPATAKIIAQLTVKAITDEQARKRLLFIILAPTIGTLLMIAFILYLITNPLTVFKEMILGEKQEIQLGLIEGFQKDYGYNQEIGIYEQDYIDGSGQNYDGVIFQDGATKVVYFNQLDERWKDKPYGTDNIGGYACGPTSMSIVISSLAGTVVDPPHMAKWAYEHGYWCLENGSYHSLIPGAAKAWGLTCKGNLSAQDIVDSLSSGKLVVVIMSRGHFTSGGHFIVLRGVTKEGKILVADPASVSRSNEEWDLSSIQHTNLLDFLWEQEKEELPIKKLVGKFSLKQFVLYDMRNFAHVTELVLDRTAFNDSDEEIAEAIEEFLMMYQVRITLIYEGLKQEDML
ncbi:MAG: C39 family peptidase, partial [Clostridiales bacterium]|nr:C39 family peptidase [Clostridiales bacterium]